MSEERKTVVLPSADEMLKRIKAIHDDDYMIERFYKPHLLPKAGRELVAEGVVLMLTLAIHDFASSGYPAMIVGILHGYVPLWIDALVDDKDVAEAAKALHQEAIDATKKDP